MTAKLRCQPGDLALVLRSPDWGKLVTCLALADEPERITFGIGDRSGPVWRIDRECMWADRGPEGSVREVPLPYAPDSALVPIYPRPELLLLDEALASDMEHFHRMAASGRLADILAQLAGVSGDLDR